MKVIWIFFCWFCRRIWLQCRLNGFKASIISLSDNESIFEGFNKLSAGTFVFRSRIGLGTYIANARVQSASVGRFCSIGPGARIGGLGRHPTDWVSTSPSFYSNLNQNGLSFCSQNYYDELSNVTVGNDVWIGARVLVLDGVSIGDGAIIAAGSVVVKDVKAYEIVGGVPAKHIRDRCSIDVVSQLRALSWWDWPFDELAENSVFFRMPMDKGVENLVRFKNGDVV